MSNKEWVDDPSRLSEQSKLQTIIVLLTGHEYEKLKIRDFTYYLQIKSQTKNLNYSPTNLCSRHTAPNPSLNPQTPPPNSSPFKF